MKLKFSEHVTVNYQDYLDPASGRYELGADKVTRRIELKKERDICPNCGEELKEVFSRFHESNELNAAIDIKKCVQCDWWTANRFSTLQEENFTIARHQVLYSVLRNFSPNDQLSTFIEIVSEINKRGDSIRKIHPTTFEKFVADVFAHYFGCKVVHVGRSHDGGVDAYLFDDAQGTLVQVKRREKKKAVEGVDTVRCLVGTMVDKGNYKGIIVSTADHFTRGAKALAKRLLDERKVSRIDLHDCKKFLRMVHVVSKNESQLWKPVIKKLWPSIYS